MRNNLYICNANLQTKSTLISYIIGSHIRTHYYLEINRKKIIRYEYYHSNNTIIGVLLFVPKQEERKQ